MVMVGKNLFFLPNTCIVKNKLSENTCIKDNVIVFFKESSLLVD